MSARPDIAATLDADETLLWQGHPKPGRTTSLRASALGASLYLATLALAVLAWWLEIFHGHVVAWRLVVYLLVAAAALCTYLALRLTLLDRRRARARDARTAYAITDRRALIVAGPYRAEVALGPEVTAKVSGAALEIEDAAARLRFERLDDAAAARDILMAATGGPT